MNPSKAFNWIGAIIVLIVGAMVIKDLVVSLPGGQAIFLAVIATIVIFVKRPLK